VVPSYRFIVRDIFRFRDGRTVFVGVAEGGPGYIARGLFEALVDGESRGLLPIEGEMMAQPASDRGDETLRSISSTEVRCVDREFLKGHEFVLRPVDLRRRLEVPSCTDI
jgi:hypothetical protein